MNYLIDTHIFLWAIFSPKKISKNIKGILIDQELTKYVSIITFWEISLKFSLGKLDLTRVLPDKLPAIAKDAGFEILDLNIDTASSFYKLPRIKNKDPFDRMLAWQAINHDYVLLTQDKSFADYKDHGLKTMLLKG